MKPLPPRALSLKRREALLGLTCAMTLGNSALALGPSSPGYPAAGSPPQAPQRLVVVILRGALDGMAALVPYGDPQLAALRATLLPPAPGQSDGLLDLGGFYGLHPALTGLHGLYQAAEFLPVHAVIGPSHSRSHFDAQDDLESGADHRLTSGWLNRVVSLMPASREPQANAGPEAMAIGASIPLLLRGPAPAANWSPEALQAPQPDLYARIAQLNQPDPVLGPAITEGLRTRDMTQAILRPAQPGHDGAAQPGHDGAAKARTSFAALAGAAGTLLGAPDGPRIAALEIGGWDTHAAQRQRLLQPLSQLDQGLIALKTGLGPAWKHTVVLVMTEFGRTAGMNGTGGTDHGTATVAFLLGGAIRGGRVEAVWPGLSPSQLFQNRDLSPTTDLRALAKGILRDHLGLHAQALAEIFPGSQQVSAKSGLLA